MAGEAVSSVDRAWLRLDEPVSPMVITAVMVFGAPIDLPRLRAAFEDRLLPFHRFRQRVVQPRQPGAALFWEADPDFHLAAHVQRLSLPPPGDEAALRAAVGELVSRQLDASRPLWQFHLVEGYGAGSALVGRVHHALADGPALMHVLRSLADEAPNADRPPGGPQGSPPGGADPGMVARLAEVLAGEGLAVLYNPARLLGLARLGRGTAAALGKLLNRAADPPTAFKGGLGTTKRVAWSDPWPLAEVKAAGGAVGGTVNDVMLAVVAGALRRYLQSRGEPVDGLVLRAGLSVNLRPPDEAPGPGNQAGAVLVSLPVGLADPAGRLRAVKAGMDALKASPEARLIHGLLQALGRATPEVQQALVETYCTRETAVMANVAGPEEGLHLGGAPLETLLFWIPAFGRVGLGLSIVSYRGQVRLTVVTDAGLVPDPERIIGEAQAEFVQLLDSVGTGRAERAVAAMTAGLDEALATLDKLLEEKG